MNYIERPDYMQRLLDLMGTPDIKIITGVRRSGKSELMKAYIRRITETQPDANIIFVDFFDLKYEGLKEYHALYEYIESHYVPSRTNYVFVDEVQLCDGFELAVNSLHRSRKYDLYLTGSNAFLLSSDLTTLFTGRYIEIPVFPFSFSEFCRYYAHETDTAKLFDEYVIRGGLAGSYEYRTERDRVNYIRDVYDTIVQRDLVSKYRLPDTTTLEHLAEFMMDNVSNMTSPNNISETLSADIIATNHKTVGNYIKYLCDAYVFYVVRRYDIRGKTYLKTSAKYYLSDTGIRFARLGRRNLDYGRMYENVVCIELMRRGYEVYVGKLYQKEVDFVAMRGDEKLYIQVSDDIARPETFEREYTPLLKIKDAYPKMILANTKHETYDYEGITIYNLPDWLLQK
ncbi:MAG: ATP-binding protein [Oscillospiraceae bacterium]|nr:ATP-binding protein [Oscillospiraceae bacterium]